MDMRHKVLLVDDEPNVLSALRRRFREEFDVHIANNGEEALDMMSQEVPFAVVVSDMRMPGLTGLQVFKRMQELAPDTVRIMLTGNADQTTAVDAINHGQVFRFLNKPCALDTMRDAICAGVAQYELVTGERVLLERTLAGSVKVLLDVLSSMRPEVFREASQVRRHVQVCHDLVERKQRWLLGLAAEVADLGLATVPREVVARAWAGETLSADERARIDEAPQIAARMLGNIPRLEEVARIVGLTRRGFDGSGAPENGPTGQDIPFGARLLRILRDVAHAMAQGRTLEQALQGLRAAPGAYDPALLEAVATRLEAQSDADAGIRAVPLAELIVGDTLVEPAQTLTGTVLLAEGTVLDADLLAKLKAAQKIRPLRQPLRVRHAA